MDYLHAFGYARSQSVRPCYLRSDHDFYMHFRQYIFRLISDKFRQSMGNSRWPCHGLSRSVTAFSDNAQDLSIVFCLLSRFVTVRHGLSRNMLGNLKPIWTFSDNMQSPTFTFRQCVRYLRSSEMTSLFACISDLTLFMRMDPQGMLHNAYVSMFHQ